LYFAGLDALDEAVVERSIFWRKQYRFRTDFNRSSASCARERI
jgi:hypothetical protein